MSVRTMRYIKGLYYRVSHCLAVYTEWTLNDATRPWTIGKYIFDTLGVDLRTLIGFLWSFCRTCTSIPSPFPSAAFTTRWQGLTSSRNLKFLLTLPNLFHPDCLPAGLCKISSHMALLADVITIIWRVWRAHILLWFVSTVMECKLILCAIRMQAMQLPILKELMTSWQTETNSTLLDS